MDRLQTIIGKLQPNNEQHSDTQKRTNLALMTLKANSNNSTESGVNHLDLIPSVPLSNDIFLRSIAMIEQAFGLPIPTEKSAMLAEMIKDEGWSEARFKAVVKWFLKNKYNPAWTIHDWFSYGTRLYPESWYHKKVSEMGDQANYQIERYKLKDGLHGYKFIDGEILPFEYLGPLKQKSTK